MIVEGDEQFVVTLSNQADSIPADSVDIVGSPQTATIENDDTANFTISSVSVNEADGTATVMVTLNGSVQGGATVNFTTVDGTAVAGSDYTSTSGTLTFTAGNDGDMLPITVPILNDDIVELTEAFTIQLSGGNAVDPNIDDNDVTATAVGTVTILDDDIDLTLSPITPVTQAEGDPGDVTQYSFTVTRAGLTTGTTTVDYTISGLADAGTMLTATGMTDFESALTGHRFVRCD